jgi:hypothetical protein
MMCGARHTVIVSLLGTPHNVIWAIIIAKVIEGLLHLEKKVLRVIYFGNIGMQASFYESKGIRKAEKYTISYGIGRKRLAEE